MSSEEIEPDAYSFERYFKMKTDSVTRFASKHPDEWIDEVVADVGVVPESIDKLFSAETIKQLIKDKRQEFNNGRDSEYPQKVLTELLEEVDQS